MKRPLFRGLFYEATRFASSIGPRGVKLEPERKRMKIKFFAVENAPTFFVMLVLTCGLLLFGADSAASSLVISIMVFVSVVTSVVVFRGVQLSPFINLLLMLWGGFVALSFMAGRVEGAEDEYLMLLSAVGVFGLGQFAGQNSNRLQTAIRCFLLLGLLFSGFAFFQHLIDKNMVLGVRKPYGLERLGGVFLSSNTAATFLGMIILLAVSNLWRTWLNQVSFSSSSGAILFVGAFQKMSLGVVICLFSFVSLLLTASRAGIAGTLLAVTVFSVWVTIQQLGGGQWVPKGRRGVRLILIASIVTLIVYIWSLSGDLVSTRYSQVFFDVRVRTDIIEASWQAFLMKPWFGYGLGGFDAARLLGATPESNAVVVYVHAAHNVYMQWLVQVGIIGTAIFAAVYIYVLTRIFRGARLARRYRTYCLAILCVSLLVGVHGIFDYALEIPVIMLCYAWLLGVGYGISVRYVSVR